MRNNEAESSSKKVQKDAPPIRKCGCLEPSFLIHRFGASIHGEMNRKGFTSDKHIYQELFEKTTKRWVRALKKQEEFYLQYKEVEAVIAKGIPLSPREGLRCIKILNTIGGELVAGRNDIIGVNIKNSLYDEIVDLMEQYQDAIE